MCDERGCVRLKLPTKKAKSLTRGERRVNVDKTVGCREGLYFPERN